MQKLRELYQKYKEIILYIVFGVLTTAVNFIIYFLLVSFVNVYITNTIAWIGAVLFAYVTNRTMVFQSKSNTKMALLKEIVLFYAARIFSYVVEMAILYVCIDLCKLDDVIPKLAAQVIVIVLNYILSKFLVFAKKSKQKS